MENKITSQISFQLIIALSIGLFLGLASLVLNPLWMLVGLGVVGFLFFLIKRPEIGLLVYLFITSTLINQDSLPKLTIGVGRLLITDIILMALLVLIFVRALVENGFNIVHTPLDLPLIGFLGIAFLSTFIAIYQSRLTFNDSLGKVRIIMSYLTFFVVTNMVREEKQLHTLLRGLFFLSTGVALAMIAQSLLGNHVQILPGRVETLDTEGVNFMGVTRIIPPGESLVFTVFLASTVCLLIDKLLLKRSWMILVWSLTGLGVIFTFKRHLWIVILLSLFLLVLVSGWRIRMKMVGMILLIMSVIIIVLLPILNQPESEMNKLVSGIFYRLASITNPETFEDPNSSLRWRDFEYQYAMPQIASHPLIGLGQGAIYRPFVVGKDRIGFDGRRYIHNGHLSIIVTSGLLGYLSFLVFSLIALVRGFKFWRRIMDRPLQAILVGFSLAFLGILIGSIISPMIVTAWWTPVIGITLGINEVILSKIVTKDIRVPVS